MEISPETAWQCLSSRDRKRVIKERQAFPRLGWPAIYPADKDPLAPRPVAVLRAHLAAAEPASAPQAQSFGMFGYSD